MFDFLKKYYIVKQHDITDCGAACLATVSRQYGLKESISTIRGYCGTDKMGTNAYGMIQAANRLGFIAKAVKAVEKRLDEKIPYPAIAHVVKENLLHYVVIHRVKKGKILVADPGEETLATYTEDKFNKIWSGVLILMVPDENMQKKDNTVGLFGRFLSLIFPHKRLVLEIFLASIIFTALGILGAFYFTYLIDEILINGLIKSLHIISIGFIILTVFKVLLDAFRKHLLLHLSQKIDISLIFQYYQHVLKLPISFFDTRNVGEILSRLNDASKIRNAISGATLTVMIDSLLVIGAGIVLFIQSWKLFLVALILLPFSILVVWLYTKPFQKIQRKLMSEAAETESYLVESLNGVSTIKALNAESEAIFVTEKKFIKFIRSVFKASWMQNIQSSIEGFITLLGGILILWIGGAMVINGNLSIGQLITFNALLAYFHSPIQNLIGLQPALQEAFVAADRLGEILDINVEMLNEDKLLGPEMLKGEIIIKNMSFRYGTREPVLDDINLVINPGEKVAIVGESGSGKTTLMKLLMKYYLPEKGEILIDGNNIKDLKTDFLRKKTGYVPQDTFMFSGTIRENICFGQADIAPEDVVRAAKNANAHEFINDMYLRYDTIIGERGATLSGGQKQRLALARAILCKPDILLLDEATSNLDSIAEKAIHQTIDRLSEGLTTIIIAHRLSTIMRCDRIIVMDRGRIVEAGTHAELMRRKKKYFELWQGQIAGEMPEYAMQES